MECFYTPKTEAPTWGVSTGGKVNPFMLWNAAASIPGIPGFPPGGQQTILPTTSEETTTSSSSPNSSIVATTSTPGADMQPVAAHYQQVLQGGSMLQEQGSNVVYATNTAHTATNNTAFPGGVRLQQYMQQQQQQQQQPQAQEQQPQQLPTPEPAHQAPPQTLDYQAHKSKSPPTKLYTEDANGEEVVYNGSAEHIDRATRGEKLERVYDCSGCEKAFTREEHLKRHAKQHTDEPVHRCEVQGCDKFFTRKERLTRHYKVVHLGQEAPRPFWCSTCGKEFQRKEHLQRHERNIHQQGGSTDLQNNVNSDPELRISPQMEAMNMQAPPSQVSAPPSIVPHSMPAFLTAARSMPLPGTLSARHEPNMSRPDRVQGQEEPAGALHCTWEGCTKTYSRKEHLTKHLKAHQGVEPERPYFCRECGKSFTRKEHLLRHTRGHTGETPFGCPDCAKQFARKEHLKRHMRVHTGEHPYPCSECGRSFGRRERLLKHLETHGIHELAHEPRTKKPKEEQDPTDLAYANLRKTYPKKEPIKQEPDFNMPETHHGVFGQTSELLKMITQTKAPLSPQQAQAYAQAQVAAQGALAAFVSPPKAVKTSGAEGQPPATSHQSVSLPSTTTVSRGPDIANSPAMPPELSKLPSTFSIFPVMQGGSVVQGAVVPVEQVQTSNGYYQAPGGYVATTMAAHRPGELTTLPMSWPTTLPTGWQMTMPMQPGMVMSRSPAKVEDPAAAYFRTNFSS